ncbi:MAG TPA: GGDEF domain-containing protein [Candidatus Solibacter sp.]|nr:GGDEF domain-containing protein [Candidatus Solibacter sp.]
MVRRAQDYRAWYFVGAATVIAVAAWEILRAPIPPALLRAEAGLFGLGIVYAIAMIMFRWQHINELATTCINVALAGAILAVAAPYLADPLPFSFGVLAITVLPSIVGGESQGRSWSHPMSATICGVFAMVAVWLRLGGFSIGVTEIVVWGGLLTGFGALAQVHWRLGQFRVEHRLERLGILVREAQRLGGSTDLEHVAVSVLTAFHECYPHLNWGAILMYDPASDTLHPLPFALSPTGIIELDAASSPPVAVKRRQGLPGIAFDSGEVQVRNTAKECARDHPTRDAAMNERIDSGIGALRSGVAAPFRNIDGEVTGVVSLVSSTSEFLWSPDDMLMVRGLTEQCGVALERGRLYDNERRNAITDHLTRLPNRREFERVLAQTSTGTTYSVLAIDFDNLKMINDEYGHEAGDTVLRLAASTLRAALRNEDVVARVGGDEFAAVLPATDEGAAREIAGRLTASMAALAVPFGSARVSIGCASGTSGSDPSEVWNMADEALYRAKSQGRNRVEIAGPREIPVEERQVRWSEVLPEILRRRDIQAVFQPIARLDSREVVGYEALARFGGSDAGVEGLFAAALRLGLTRDLDWLCRHAAMRESHHLPPDALLFLNVGIPALLDPLHPVDQMLLLLRWAGRSPADTVLELSEREAVTDMDRFAEVLADYRAEGFRFAMDDVGEGHSTLEVLAQGVPEYIKIARQLTRRASRSGPRSAIRALATFARDNGALLIAEGIEDNADIEIMRDLGVHLGQGYALGRPGREYQVPDERELSAVVS